MSKNSKKEKNGKKPMAKDNETATVEQIVVTRKLFNLDTFVKEEKTEKIDPPKVAASMEQVLEALGYDETKIVDMYNKSALRMLISATKKAMTGTNLVSPKIVSGLISGWLAQFPLTYTGEDAKKKKAAREAQREAVYDKIRSQPALHASYKMIALDMAALAGDEEGDEEEDES